MDVMFTIGERDIIRERITQIARSDSRVTGGALIGSLSRGAGDRWSDIDLTFGIVPGTDPHAILDEWTSLLDVEYGVLDYFDLPAGPSIYRVLVLRNGLELNVSVTPEREFGARGPAFQMLFGRSREVAAPPAPNPDFLAGMIWHHILHARNSIERRHWWRAEYWLNEARNHTLDLACLRLGFSAVHGRGYPELPDSVTAPLEAGLVRSLDAGELRRALGVVTHSYLRELKRLDPERHDRLRPLLADLIPIDDR